jgi:hypothetical protein
MLFMLFYIFITGISLVLGTMLCLYVQIFLFQTNTVIIFQFTKSNKGKKEVQPHSYKIKGYHISCQVCSLHNGAFWCSGGVLYLHLQNSLKIKVLQSFGGLETTHPMTQCHIPEDFNLQSTVNFSENAHPYSCVLLFTQNLINKKNK